MIDKVQKIREEVEKLFNHVKDSNFESDSGAFYYLKDLLDFIDSLQEEPVSEELNNAAVEWFNSVKYKSDLSGTPIEGFKAGAKWKEKKDQEIIETAIHHAYHKGYKQAILDALKYIKSEQEIRQEPCSDMVELVNHLYNKINSKD